MTAVIGAVKACLSSVRARGVEAGPCRNQVSCRYQVDLELLDRVVDGMLMYSLVGAILSKFAKPPDFASFALEITPNAKIDVDRSQTALPILYVAEPNTQSSEDFVATRGCAPFPGERVGELLTQSLEG